MKDFIILMVGSPIEMVDPILLKSRCIKMLNCKMSNVEVYLYIAISMCNVSKRKERKLGTNKEIK